ncbi:MAG: hypothetical protein AABX54_02850 [Nanoarchaeota archaeon]
MKKDSSANPISGKTYALILTIVILIIGSFFYFTAVNNINATGMKFKGSTDAKLQEKMQSEDNPIDNNPTTNINTIPENKEESMTNNNSEIKTQISNSLFDHIQQENKIYAKKNSEGYIKLFYYYTGEVPMDIQLSEGNINDYQIHTIGGQNYYPLILGYEEAEVMRQEGLFTNIGDPIKNFFGKNVVVIGVMKKTDGVLDTIHIIPLNNGELN